LTSKDFSLKQRISPPLLFLIRHQVEIQAQGLIMELVLILI